MPDNRISTDLPRSTVAVGVAFWGVLVALMGWALIRLTMISENQSAMNQKLDNQQQIIGALLLRQNGVETRLAGLETQVAILKLQVERPR